MFSGCGVPGNHATRPNISRTSSPTVMPRLRAVRFSFWWSEFDTRTDRCLTSRAVAVLAIVRGLPFVVAIGNTIMKLGARVCDTRVYFCATTGQVFAVVVRRSLAVPSGVVLAVGGLSFAVVRVLDVDRFASYLPARVGRLVHR